MEDHLERSLQAEAGQWEVGLEGVSVEVADEGDAAETIDLDASASGPESSAR